MNQRLPRMLAIVLGAAALTVVTPTAHAAPAGTITLDDSSGQWVLTISDIDAADHHLHITQAGGANWVIDEQNYDAGARLPASAPAECSRSVVPTSTAHEEELFCPFANAPEKVVVDTGAGADVIDYHPADPVPGTLSGGQGDDLVMGGPGDDTLRGDTGTADVSGDGGDTLDGGCGVDTYYGGGGIDAVSFQARETLCAAHATGVEASLDDHADDGPENENIGGLSNSIEGIVGSDGDDALTGNAADNQLSGLGGDDVLNGLAGPDDLVGGAGADVLTGGAGNDKLYGDDNSGTGAGADYLHADDGEADAVVDCGGAGGDNAFVDDAATDAHVSGCESVHRPAPPKAYDPTVITGDASLVTTDSARLFAEVNAHGSVGGTYFWVLSPKFGTTLTQLPDPGRDLPVDSARHTVSLDVTHLQPGTAYAVYACVTGNKHVICGSTHAFTTQPPPAVQAAGVSPAATSTKVGTALASATLKKVAVPVTPQASGKELLGTYTLVKADTKLPKGGVTKAVAAAAADVAKGTASLLPPAASLLQLGAGRIIGNDGASLITNDGGSLITNDGGSLITNDGGSRLFVDQVALRRKKKRTRYLLVLISYVKKTVTKGKRVVLKLHYTRAGKKLLKAAHKRDRHLRAHHRKREPKGILLDVEFKKRGAKHAIRATQPVYVHARK